MGGLGLGRGLGLDLCLRNRPVTDGGGGGEAPEWVPEEFVDGIWIEPRVIDGFSTGRAWVAGVGEVDVDTLLGADPNTANFAVSNYVEADLTADGLTLGSNPAFIGAARTAILAGSTGRISYKMVEGSTANFTFGVTALDGLDAINVSMRMSPINRARGFSGNGPLDLEILGIVNTDPESRNAFAFTLVTDRLDIAANGSAAETGAVDAVDRPPGNPLVAAMVLSTNVLALEAVGILTTPLPDTTGLSALSATVL